MSAYPHPAQFSPAILDLLRLHLDPAKHRRVLDPFAGVGNIHQLRDHGFETVGVEIEARWARASKYTEKGDATDLRWRARSFDAIVTSPTYGNRLADRYVPKAGDTSKRLSYRISLGIDLRSNNTGQLQWGDRYRTLHEKAWAESVRVLRPGGRFILNCKNHLRNGEEQKVCEWHIETLIGLGLVYSHEVEVEGPQGFKFSPTPNRCPEMIYVLDKEPSEQ